MEGMRKKLILIVVAILTLSVASRAEDIALDTIVITSSRSDEYVKNTPYNIAVITRKDIERSQAKTTVALLKEKAGVKVTEFSSGNGKLADVEIRGFGGTGGSNTLVLVDGRRVTQIDLSGTDWTEVPLDSVERIEVIRGAGSVLYGDNATGGVVNIITREGKSKPKIQAKTEIGSYASYDNTIEASGKINDFSYFSLAKYFQSAGYRNNNDIRSKDFSLKLGYHFSDLLNTKLNLGLHRDSYGLPGSLSDDRLNSPNIGRKGTTAPFNDATTLDYFGDLMLENDFQEKGRLSSNLSLRVRQVKSNYLSSSPLWETDNYITTFGLTPKYILNTAVLHYDNKITLGFDFYDIQDHIKSGTPNTENNVITISKRSWGLYLFDRLTLIDQLTASVGWRYEKARYNFEQISAVSLQKSLAKMNKVQVLNTGLNYTYDANDSNLFANFSQSFRFPMTDEMYSPGYASPEYTSAGGLNINLDTQKANNFDLGLRHYFRKNIYSGITFYRMDVRNEIYYNQYIDENMNYDKTLHQGIEFESKMRLGDKANLFANYTCCIAKFIKGEFGGNSIPAVPLHKWSAGFDIDLLKALNFSLVTNYVGERNFLSDQKDNFPPLGSYTTVDIKLAYNKDNFSVYGGINNLFNEDYSEYGVVSNYYMNKNYYPSRRRNFIFGSSLKF